MKRALGKSAVDEFWGEWREYEVMNGANKEGKKEERGRKEEA